jgi:hypothetical protein
LPANAPIPRTRPSISIVALGGSTLMAAENGIVIAGAAPR